MNSSPNLLVTVHAKGHPKFGIPVPLETENVSRESTVFHIVAADSSISILGTYDELLDFAADIGHKVMSWPIVSGRSDWFGQQVFPTQKEEGISGDGSNDTAGSQEWGDS